MSNFEQEWAKRYNVIQDKSISKMITFPSKKTVQSFGNGTGLNILYPAGKFWGYAKEGLDITKKVLEGQPFLEILKDSQKDLNNNDESLNWGLNNPNASVRKWLRGLDINTNTWKKQNE